MRLILLTVFLLFSRVLFAQDYIIKKDGEKMEVKVLEVSSTHIKYRKFTQLEGPDRRIEVSMVKEIIYEDGQFETFDKPKTTESTPQPINIKPAAPELTPEEELKKKLRRDPIMKSGITVEGIFGYGGTERLVYKEYIVGYDQWGYPIYNYGYETEPVRYISLSVKLANKWYFNQSDTWRTGLQVNWFRFGLFIDPSDIAYSVFLGPKVIAPLNVGWTNVIRLNDEWGIEANITGGMMLNFDLDYGNIYDGYAFNPEIKFRHDKLSFGLDYMYFNDSRVWNTFGFSIGAKL